MPNHAGENLRTLRQAIERSFSELKNQRLKAYMGRFLEAQQGDSQFTSSDGRGSAKSRMRKRTDTSKPSRRKPSTAKKPPIHNHRKKRGK